MTAKPPTIWIGDVPYRAQPTADITLIDGIPHRIAPLLTPAAAQTLAIIRRQPGISVSGVARERGVTPKAASYTALRLERGGLITTALVSRQRGAHERACYPKEEGHAL